MVRAASFLTGLLGIVLVFLLASKLTNRTGGCVAAMLLAMCPVYALDRIDHPPGASCRVPFRSGDFLLATRVAEDCGVPQAEYQAEPRPSESV